METIAEGTSDLARARGPCMERRPLLWRGQPTGVRVELCAQGERGKTRECTGGAAVAKGGQFM
eukprot:CAMPEP_0203963530 /NCGR_PEP_ID=MMETSP0359-20131031/93455_1 /ASSEMBLY_ACC=CAM_ASM_000338 /TAXON_ID=268821 /ORGANISM="Scrippsiella Hangoei, Strain SHTV-5" /LENGTH=62 /DNA_ID=CAMNT_0050899403 /DNA_START=30 /DNA_END=218 /DNA_ORIENTATION=+